MNKRKDQGKIKQIPYQDKVQQALHFFEERDGFVSSGIQGPVGEEKKHFITMPRVMQVDLLFLHSLCAEIFLAYEIQPASDSLIKIVFIDVR